MVEEDATETVDPVQADLEVRLARLWSAIELLDRYSWRVLEGVVVDDDARASLTAAYTSATAAARANGLTDVVGAAVRSTLAVVATIEGEVSWTAKRWVEYAATALVCRRLLFEDLVTDDGSVGVTPAVDASAPVVEAVDGVASEVSIDVEAEPEPRLVGGDFGWVEYEILTCTWRSVVGEMHPDDPPMTEDLSDEPDEDEWWLDADDVDDVALLDEPGTSAARDRVDALWTFLNRPVHLTLRRARSDADGERDGRLAVVGRGR